MIIDELLKGKAQNHQYISSLFDAQREELLKTGYFDKQLQQNPALTIHQDGITYNQEQNNVINYLFKKHKTHTKMPIRQQCVLEEIVSRINKINTPQNNNIGKDAIFAISDVEGDVYSLLRFLKHIGALQSISIIFDKNGNPQLVPNWNHAFNAKIVFDGDHTSCRSFFNKECVDILLSLQEKFSKNNIFLVKGNHEYNIYYDGAEKGSVLYDAKKKIYDKCIDKAIIQSGKDIYHFMHSANFALASSKIRLPKKFNTECDDIVDFPRTYKMTDNEIITNMMKFQNFIHTKRFLAPQNHHIVFGHDIDWDKAISKRLKKYGMLPVDNDNKNYFCISNDNIIEYDNGTGIQVDSYKIAKPILTQEHINNFQQFKQHHDHTRQYSNRNCQNNANKNLRQYKKPRYKTNKYSNQNMRDIFLKVIANRQNLSKYNHNYNKKYI